MLIYTKLEAMHFNCCHSKSCHMFYTISSHSLSSSERQFLDPELQCDLWPDDRQLPTSPTDITPEPTTNNNTVSLTSSTSSPSLQASKTPDNSPTSLQSTATSNSVSILLIIVLFYSLTYII